MASLQVISEWNLVRVEVFGDVVGRGLSLTFGAGGWGLLLGSDGAHAAPNQKGGRSYPPSTTELARSPQTYLQGPYLWLRPRACSSLPLRHLPSPSPACLAGDSKSSSCQTREHPSSNSLKHAAPSMIARRPFASFFVCLTRHWHPFVFRPSPLSHAAACAR
jgi:hypothetical protein